MQHTLIKERPILMSAPMARAILDGKKTMTRRVVKPQPTFKHQGNYERAMRTKASFHEGSPRNFIAAGWRICVGWGASEEAFSFGVCPYGKPGERLWVREKFIPNSDNTFCCFAVKCPCGYAEEMHSKIAWKSPLHLPRKLSRILLEIVSVRVERVQDISRKDIVAEGWPGAVRLLDPNDTDSHYAGATQGDWINSGMEGDDDCIEWFAENWDAISSKGSWDQNPWCWAIEFKRLEPK